MLRIPQIAHGYGQAIQGFDDCFFGGCHIGVMCLVVLGRFVYQLGFIENPKGEFVKQPDRHGLHHQLSSRLLFCSENRSQTLFL